MRKTKKEMIWKIEGVLESRLLKGNTVVYRTESENSVCIRFHETDILKFDADGNVTLDSGGYRTQTTKDRLNEFQSAVYVYQENFIWYVRFKNDSIVKFYDGMVIDLDTGRMAL